MIKRIASCVLCGLLALTARAGADEQRLAPGTGDQGIVEVDTGPNGLCETTAAGDDFQLAPVGAASPNQPAVECDGGGGNGIVDTTAAGDDVQLVAVGAPCTNNQLIINTGPDGVANTAADGDDVQVQAVGTSPANAPCIGVGPNGIADTPDPVGADDVRQQAFGTGNANATVVRCGPNGIAETTANNFNPAGDDVQVLTVGTTGCGANAVVVNAGPNGIADTRAEGPDLMVKAGKRVKLNIPLGQPRFSKQVKIDVSNIEFGGAAPASRSYRLDVDEGSCPNGSVTQVDADAKTPGLQATAMIPKDGKIKATFFVTYNVDQVNTVSKKIPERCFIDVTAVVDDPAFDANNPDDDRTTDDNNRTQIAIEVFDKNDL